MQAKATVEEESESFGLRSREPRERAVGQTARVRPALTEEEKQVLSEIMSSSLTFHSYAEFMIIFFTGVSSSDFYFLTHFPHSITHSLSLTLYFSL